MYRYKERPDRDSIGACCNRSLKTQACYSTFMRSSTCGIKKNFIHIGLKYIEVMSTEKHCRCRFLMCEPWEQELFDAEYEGK